MAYPISDVTRRVVYTGSAGVGPYSFTFEVLANTDIQVYKNTTLQTLTTNYTVTINANGTGSVTLVVAATGADNITIVGDRAIQRATDFVTGGDLFANTLNDEFDSLVIFAQQIDEKADRGLKAPVTDPTDVNMVLPVKATRIGTVLAFNATTGNPEAGPSIASVTTVAAQSANINTVAGISANVTTVAGISSNVTTVAGISANVSTVAGIASNVTTVAGISSAVSTVSANSTNVTTVAGISADVTTNATNIVAIQNASTNASSAAASASTATTQAASATSSASAASTSASNAATSATNAANSATAAAASAASINLSTIVSKTSATGAAIIPVGTTGQRDVSPAAGYLRFNSTLTKPEVYNGTAWGSVGGGATGGGSDEIFIENGQTVSTNYTITASKNAMSTGPITINSSITVTVPTGSRWVVV